MKKVNKYLKRNSLRMLLIFIVLLLLLYLFSGCFRLFLLEMNIDPNFIIGFFTILALVLSLIQSSYDKRFNYNMNLVNSIEEKGLSIIAKLLTIRQKSEILFITIKQVKNAINSDAFYIDSNDVLSKEDIEKDFEMASAYIQTYFPEEGSAWNDLQNKLSTLATNCSGVLLNYKENIKVLKNPHFTNIILDKIDQIIIESESLYEDIDKSAEDMYERIVIKLNDYKDKLKDGFNFKI